MTPHSRIRRIGWFAALAICAMLYLGLHLKVHAVRSEVIRAERQIVLLEQQKVLLETEFQTRSNQLQLEEWNRVDFGYTAPSAAQFLENERQLASFGSPRAPGAPEPIRVAGAGGDTPAYPKLVSPLTGKPIDEALLEPERQGRLSGTRLADGSMRVPLGAVIASASE
ncbi:MAG TPA: hypothetical protein VFS49_06540 [Croceibacterium sp.]|nr:hypothetical protein [Croceibacterium sp.]